MNENRDVHEGIKSSESHKNLDIKIEPKEEYIDENDDEQFTYGPKNTHCEICGKIFESEGYLERHIQSVHEGVKKFKCDSCAKTFSKNSDLNIHIKSVHEDIKNHNKSFGLKHNSKRHISNIHEGMKNHKSENEPEYIKRVKQGNVKMHTNPVFHERPSSFIKLKKYHKCDICGISFKTAPELKIHVSFHAAVEVAGHLECELSRDRSEKNETCKNKQ